MLGVLKEYVDLREDQKNTGKGNSLRSTKYIGIMSSLGSL